MSKCGRKRNAFRLTGSVRRLLRLVQHLQKHVHDALTLTDALLHCSSLLRKHALDRRFQIGEEGL
ncbi:MAG: hypothetical protein J6J21_01345, partial [Clostridia bacterium]|nr:hypothetical protein [Clostridia bacterium]